MFLLLMLSQDCISKEHSIKGGISTVSQINKGTQYSSQPAVPVITTQVIFTTYHLTDGIWWPVRTLRTTVDTWASRVISHTGFTILVVTGLMCGALKKRSRSFGSYNTFTHKISIFLTPKIYFIRFLSFLYFIFYNLSGFA